MEHLRQVGKILTISICIVAIFYGIMHKRYFAPFELSVACWIALTAWIVGAVGVRIQKHRAQRTEK